MSLFRSILVPLDGSRTAARSLGCATWLASRLGARLHVLSATPRVLPARDALARLQIAEEHWPLVELHQAEAYPEDSIMAAIVEHDVGLVVMTARGATVEQAGGSALDTAKILGHVTHAVIERSPVPVLLLPPAYQEVLPWERALVPLSGGDESDAALVLAVPVATAIDLTVYVAHVAEPRGEGETLATQARYADALHHEYRDRVEELVARAIPALTREQCRRIRSTALSSGDIAGELLRRMQLDQINVLVVGWHGQFATGRARILKQLIPAVQTPVLLARSVAPPRFRLEVGEALGGR